MRPNVGIKSIIPSVSISSRSTDLFKDWTYDQVGLTYDEVGYTYDGFMGYSTLKPRVNIQNMIPRVNIK